MKQKDCPDSGPTIFSLILTPESSKPLIIFRFRLRPLKRNSDLSVVKNRKAGKIAKQRLTIAARSIKEGLRDKFYEEVLKALWGYLSDKLNIPISDLTRNSAVKALTDNGADDILISKLTLILDKCEYARYAPTDEGSEIEDLYDSASGLIRDIENILS